MKKGIWVECPGEWIGWHGLITAGDGRASIFTFDGLELASQLDRARRRYPNAVLIEAREAPEEIEWNEAIWRQCRGLAA